jgi:hypothetical protein
MHLRFNCFGADMTQPFVFAWIHFGYMGLDTWVVGTKVCSNLASVDYCVNFLGKGGPKSK